MRRGGGALAAHAALSVGLLYAVWCVPFLPTHDGPNHLANCVLANRLGDPSSPLHAWLEAGAPLTTQGFQLVCVIPERLFGWRGAHALSLSLIVLGWAWGYAYLATALDRRSPLRFLGYAMALSWCLYMGFVNFLSAASLAFVVLGAVVRRPTLRPLDWLLLGAALLLVLYCHVFVAAFLGIAASAVVLLRAEPRERPGLALRLALSGGPAALLALRVNAPDQHPVEWHGLLERLRDLGELSVGGPLWRSLPPTLIALAALAAALVALARGTLPAGQRGLAVLALALVLGFFAAPLHAEPWAYFSPRFLAFGLPLAAASLPPAPRGRGRSATLALHALVLGCAVVSIGWSVGYHRALAPHVEAALAGVEAPLRRSGPRLTLFLSERGNDLGVAENEPLDGILRLYLFEQGGVDPYLFATEAATDPIVYRDTLPRLFGNVPDRFPSSALACAGQSPACPPLAEQYEWHALYGGHYEDVVLFADDERAFEIFAARGYATDFRRGPLAILRPGRCRLELELGADPGATLDGDARLVVGRVGLPRPAVVQAVPRAQLEAGTRLVLEGPDCGALWFRLERPGRACREADGPLGVGLHASPTAPGRGVCTLVPISPASAPAPTESTGASGR